MKFQEILERGTQVPLSSYQSVFYHFGNRQCSLDALLQSLNSMKQSAVTHCVLGEQVHGNDVKIINPSHLVQQWMVVPHVDGLVTKQTNVLLCIKTADCVPVLLYDVQKGIVGAIHAGREGTRKNILPHAICSMKKAGGTPENIMALLGPAICGKHYPVSDELFQKFVADTGQTQMHPWLDMKKVLISQLLEAGVRVDHIQNDETCTNPAYGCGTDFFGAGVWRHGRSH